MNRKGLIISIAAVVLLAAGILYAVTRLYSEPADPAGTVIRPAVMRFPVLAAVPSDAMAVFCFDGSRAAQRLLADSTGIFGALVTPDAAAPLKRFIAEAGRFPVAVSLHNSGQPVPLFIADVRRADSLKTVGLAAWADSAGLKSSLLEEDGLLVATSSETLLGSARRHLSEGISVSDAQGLSEAVSEVTGGNVVLLRNDAAPRLCQAWLNAPYRKYATFLKRFARWTAFSISEESGLRLEGAGGAGDDAACFVNVLRNGPSGDIEGTKMLPSWTAEAYAIPTENGEAYVAARKRYADAQGGMDRFTRPVDQFVKRFDVKEAVKASWNDADTTAQVLLIRCGRRSSQQKVVLDNAYAGIPAVLFGDLFALPYETANVSVGDWLVIGGRSLVEAYANGQLPGPRTLKDHFSETSTSAWNQKNIGFALYFSPDELPQAVPDIFRKPLATCIGAAKDPTRLMPVTLTAVKGTRDVALRLSVRQVKANRSRTAASAEVARDTLVEVPAGPFQVRNSGTGKMNTFYQNSALSLCLNDENGKGMWGVPFKQRLCGRVEEIDYYNNGRIQFLFAAGDKLYLMDRLGRFVGGFPVSLGKAVRLGPDAYDFTGAHGYTAMVLHTDNTLELYDLHGRKANGWQGISAQETIKGLPELVEAGGKRYWIVRTSLQTSVYGFNGGEPLSKGEGNKMFRPDTEITVTSRGHLSGVCYDGKTREVKL